MTEGFQRNRAIQIIIVSGRELVRAGLRAMLAGFLGLTVVGEAFDEPLALELCRKVQPDIVLLDVQSSDTKSLATLRSFQALHPPPKIIILTTEERSDYLLEARKAGAAGYLFKDVTQQALIATIQEALSSGSRLYKARQTTTAIDAKHRPAEGSVQPTEHLTARELDVLYLVAHGFTNRQIAERLALRPGTVKVHVERIVDKLAVTNRMQAVMRAIEIGLIRDPHLPPHNP